MVSDMLLRTAVRLTEVRKLGRVSVVNLSDLDTDLLFSRVDAAWGVIREYAPLTFSKVQQSFKYLLILPPGGAAGTYRHGLRACGLGANHLLNDSATSVAMTIVHEAAHARIARAGIPYSPVLRERIERICVTQEIEFGMNLPEATALIAEAENALATGWWRDGPSRDRRRAQLAALGLLPSRCTREGTDRT